MRIVGLIAKTNERVLPGYCHQNWDNCVKYSECEIAEIMVLMGVDRAEAITILAIEHGDSDGDVINTEECLDKQEPDP